MLHFITGRPGATKSLNAFKTVCTEAKYQGRGKFYHNIKLNLLDYQQCKTFQAFFYDVYYPKLNKAEQSLLADTLKPIHAEKRFVELTDVPFLAQPFARHTPLDQWLKWVKICYPAQQVAQVTEIQKHCPDGVELTFRDFEALNLHWTYFSDPHTWYEIDGYSVLVIDEAQEFFPVRSGKDRVPLYASKFERHRHDSFDVILISQHPAFLDVHVRRLAGHHTHFFNFWGSSRVTRYSWDKCVDPDDHFAKKEGAKSVITKPKKYFGVYFSAFEHTHTFKLPKILFFIPVLLVVVVLALYFAYSQLMGDKPTTESNTATEEAAQNANAFFASESPNRSPSLEQYLTIRKPRLAGLVHTAPIYDELTRPRAFQKPMHCLLWKVDTPDEQCTCYSQRITKMDVPDYLCQSIVENGYFDETISDKQRRKKSSSDRKQVTRYKPPT